MDNTYMRFLNSLGGAIAVVENGNITWCSDMALSFGLAVGMPIGEILPQGVTPEELETIQQLGLPALGERIYANVCPTEEAIVLVLHENLSEINRNALAQISRMLRSPLNDIMSTSNRLFERLEEMEDPRIQAQTASLNRSFYQLMRTAASLSDMQQSAQEGMISPRRTELRSWLERIARPAMSAVRSAGRILEVNGPTGFLFAEIDAPVLEQALWCLLSNAIRYSSEGSTISLSLQKLDSQCLFTLRNQVTQPVQLNILTGGFTRPLMVEPDGHGLGLGILRAQRMIQQHGGVLMLSCSPQGEFMARFRIPGRLPQDTLRSKQLPPIRTGGFDQMLVELSDALPDEIYDSRNL